MMLLIYRDFFHFLDLGFSKIPNFNDRFSVGGQNALSGQISSKSTKRLRRYGYLIVFKMAAVCHLEFLKFKIF